MAFDELAQRLFGARRAESDAILTDATTGTIHGVALTDSEDGAVTVEITADVTAPEPLEVGGETYFADAGVGVEIPTSESVRAGDEVLVSTYGAGTMRSPVVTAAVGSGDRMAASVSNAEELATEAKDVAEATGQNFWPDTDGVHVTQVTKDEWNDSTSPNYHSGANVLLNALGQLFRDGLNNILAILSGTTPGVAIYDGQGNDADNILAEFTADHVRIGGDVPDGTGVESAVQFFDQTETHDTDMTASTYFDGGSGYQTMQSTVNLSSTLADEGKAIDTGSSGTAALDLSNALENGISATGEQHNEVIAALVADASYSDGYTTSHAAVRATATTTNGSHLSHAELIGDAIGIGTSENSIDYYSMSRVNTTLQQWWETFGTAGSGGATFRLPYAGTWLLVTGHNSTPAANGIWVLRTGGNLAVKIGGGGNVTVTLSGTSLTVKSTGGTVGVYACHIASA